MTTRTTVPTNNVMVGHIERFEVSEGQSRVSGWVYQPDTPFSGVSISLDGEPWTDIPLIDRPDIQADRLEYSCPLRCGFDVRAPLPAGLNDARGATISLTPHAGGRATDTYRTYFCRYDEERRTLPQPNWP